MSQLITLAEAKKMIKTYKDNKESILDPAYQNKDITPTCETFDRTSVEKLFQQNDCVKLRIYFSMDDDLLIKAVLVGVNSNDEDILTPGYEVIVDRAFRCPTICPPTSELIS